MARHFTPITELDPTLYDVQLPDYVPAERIGVDTRRLGVIATVGGFLSDVRLSAYSGERTTYQTEIVGYDNQGSAYAGATSAKYAPRVIPTFTTPHDPELAQVVDEFCHMRQQLHLRINTTEIQELLRNNLRSPHLWAAQLNSNILEGVRRETRVHNIGNLHNGGSCAGWTIWECSRI